MAPRRAELRSRESVFFCLRPWEKIVMCGIAGILQKTNADFSAAIGHALLTMAACLQHRGMDSAGMAVFAAEGAGMRLQGMLPPGTSLPEPQLLLALGAGRLSDLRPERHGFSAAVGPAGPVKIRYRPTWNVHPGAGAGPAGYHGLQPGRTDHRGKSRRPGRRVDRTGGRAEGAPTASRTCGWRRKAGLTRPTPSRSGAGPTRTSPSRTTGTSPTTTRCARSSRRRASASPAATTRRSSASTWGRSWNGA